MIFINIEVKNYLLNLHIDIKVKFNPNIGGTEKKDELLCNIFS